MVSIETKVGYILLWRVGGGGRVGKEEGGRKGEKEQRESTTC